MSDRIQRKLFLHAETDKAVLVDTRSVIRDGEGEWLPKSMIEETSREHVKNPLFGTEPQIAMYRGTLLTFTAPAWLLEKRRLATDAEV